jgi:hypothetical protein
VWVFHITSGIITHNSEFEGTAYSGTGAGRNSPAAETQHGVGPLPRGKWHIGPAHDHPRLGPCVMNLEPCEGTEVFGRSAFRIHGDNKAHDASHGCIVAGPAIRRKIAESNDHDLTVLS